MSRREQIEKQARKTLREIEKIGGGSSGLRYIAERADIIRAAYSLAADLDVEELDVFALIELARFLAGDTVEGS